MSPIFSSIASKHERSSVSSYRIVQTIIPYPAYVCKAKEFFFNDCTNIVRGLSIESYGTHYWRHILYYRFIYRIIFFSITISHSTNFQLFQELLEIRTREKRTFEYLIERHFKNRNIKKTHSHRIHNNIFKIRILLDTFYMNKQEKII
jgi:hypothetical protein